MGSRHGDADGGGGGMGPRPHFTHADELLRVRRRVAAPLDASAEALRPAALEVSSLLATVAAELAAQAEQVQFVADAAEESRSNVAKGNRELRKATERPSAMRDAVLALTGVLALALIFLDWYTP